MLHRFAIVTCVATYVLLLVGGLVHITGSSLACPDWPLCHGQFFPAMEHGVEYEHSHRLVAGTVSVMTCALSAWIFFEPTMKRLRPYQYSPSPAAKAIARSMSRSGRSSISARRFSRSASGLSASRCVSG